MEIKSSKNYHSLWKNMYNLKITLCILFFKRSVAYYLKILVTPCLLELVKYNCCCQSTVNEGDICTNYPPTQEFIKLNASFRCASVMHGPINFYNIQAGCKTPNYPINQNALR